MTLGTLYGVGVGPGAPDLVTIRAVNVLRTVPVIAIPRRSPLSPSLAWEIVKPSVSGVAGQEHLFLTFPMTKDPALLRPAWDVALSEIGVRLEGGLSVAFVTEGDPFVYSTFIYLLREALRRWSGLRVEVVPGVSSITAVPAAAGVPLADGLERVAILPATYGVDDLCRVLESFDTTILMKVGSVMPAVVDAVEQRGLLGRAVYVSKATSRAERVVRDLRQIRNERCDYFSTVVVARRDRSGVLAGVRTDEEPS
jgi:precorrin-2/cobalt-factor-2 C20-methyltransferase